METKMNAILRWPAVHEVTGLSRSTVWRLERGGNFPKRRKITNGAVGWIRCEIENWVETRECAQS